MQPYEACLQRLTLIPRSGVLRLLTGESLLAESLIFKDGQGSASRRNRNGAPLVGGDSVKSVVKPDARIQSLTGDHVAAFVVARRRYPWFTPDGQLIVNVLLADWKPALSASTEPAFVGLVPAMNSAQSLMPSRSVSVVAVRSGFTEPKLAVS